MDVWYTITGGVQRGPFSDADIREQCRSGLLKRSDYVWKGGEKDWKPVGETELSGLFPPPIPPGLIAQAPQQVRSVAAAGPSGKTVIKWAVIIALSIVLFFALGFLPPMVRALLVPLCAYLANRGIDQKKPGDPSG